MLFTDQQYNLRKRKSNTLSVPDAKNPMYPKYNYHPPGRIDELNGY